MMNVHVLNGDVLAEKFPFSEQTIICRECLIDGPVDAPTLDLFWNMREAYLVRSYEEVAIDYNAGVKDELTKIVSLKPGTVIHLWFEHDLFCQANMWFILYLLTEYKIGLPVFRVMPPPQSKEVWSGFGRMNASDLKNCFNERLQFSKTDIELGAKLWVAFQKQDHNSLRNLSQVASRCFPHLTEVCEAHIQRFAPDNMGRPQKRLKQILTQGYSDFHHIFREFSKTEGIYGFGDTQVKTMITNL